MKKITTMLCLLLMSISIPLFAQENKAIKELSNIKGVTAIFVSEQMLNMIGLSNFSVDNVINLNDIASKIKSVTVLNAEDSKPIKELRKGMDTYLGKLKVSPMLTTKEDDEQVNIYFIEPQAADKYAQLIIYTDEGDEVSIIALIGSFEMKDFMKKP